MPLTLLLRAAAVALALHAAPAFKYTVDYGTEGGGMTLGVAERVVYITEGPMYADGEGPFQNGPSEISVSFRGEGLREHAHDFRCEAASCLCMQVSPSGTTRRRFASTLS